MDLKSFSVFFITDFFASKKMENICLKFPHIFEQINELLNNRTLVKSKEASRTLYSVLENQKARKYQWIRIIQSYLQVSNEFKEDWRIVFTRLSEDKLEIFAKYVQKFCKIDRLRIERVWSVTSPYCSRT